MKCITYEPHELTDGEKRWQSTILKQGHAYRVSPLFLEHELRGKPCIFKSYTRWMGWYLMAVITMCDTGEEWLVKPGWLIRR